MSEDRTPSGARTWLKKALVDVDDLVDAARRRLDGRLGRNLPRHLAAYRGYGDARGAELFGRVLAREPHGGPGETDAWWDNLLNTYRRFDSKEVPGIALKIRFRDAEVDAISDHEGYYTAAIATTSAPSGQLWDNATASLHDGTVSTAQPIMQVGEEAGYGVISDIDDTILHSSITSWKTAAQLTFLHNARTRQPLQGVSALYQALQDGAEHSGRHPVFYVSSSPWNLYDLLEDFMDLNAIPPGPIFLRDFGLDPGKFVATPGHHHKLDRARMLIERFPQLRWVLMGDSGQADAELYSEAARTYGDRIAAIYIRDVDPDDDSAHDLRTDCHIERVAGTSVPMLRVSDSFAIAEHAAGLGLLDPQAVARVASEVRHDQHRPSLAEAALDGAAEAEASTGG
ncbi:MAG: DUF2183 domain-containing protein [Pseudomonadota bacterium]|nr:DUF2183 domain-containing protein [Pseudomonadota bacterium]